MFEQIYKYITNLNSPLSTNQMAYRIDLVIYVKRSSGQLVLVVILTFQREKYVKYYISSIISK